MEKLREEVAASERAFAKSMADRDQEAFRYWLSEEAIFFTTDTPLRGKEAIAEFWSRFYEGTKSPFSWDPDSVEVLSSGKLAFSCGPVHDPSGKLTGRFNSIWRLEEHGEWRVVFDKGSPAPRQD